MEVNKVASLDEFFATTGMCDEDCCIEPELWNEAMVEDCYEVEEEV